MKRMIKRRKLLALMICMAMLLSMMPTFAYGAASTEGGMIDLNSKKDLKGKGYVWDASKHTLTLTNADLVSDGTPIIKLPDSGDVVIELKGENHLSTIDSSTAAIMHSMTGQGGKVTFQGNGTGSLSIKGYVNIYNDDVTVSDCILYIEPFGRDIEGWYSFCNAGEGSLMIQDKARMILKGGLNGIGDLVIDNGSLEASEIGILYIYGSVEVKNKGELHVNNSLQNQSLAAVDVTDHFTADETSVVEIINHGDKYGIYIAYGDVEILSKEVYIKGLEQAIFTETYKRVPTITLPKEIQYDYVTKIEISGDQWYHANLYERYDRTKLVQEIQYISEEAKTEKEKIKSGIENTTIQLKSSYTSKNGIYLDWKKSSGYRVDYYEVFRSVKRNSGYTKKPFYTTEFGLKSYYTNTADLQKGQMYYYKVRGVREVDCEKYYTKWSNKAWRRAK